MGVTYTTSSAATYVPIQTYTLASASSPVTFSSIPSTYTDLVLISSVLGVTGTSYSLQATVNSDSATNYSVTWLLGNGTAASSSRTTSAASMYLGQLTGYLTTDSPMTAITNFSNYANTTTYKTMLSRGNNAGTDTEAIVGLWRSTAAINRIDLSLASGTSFQIGSTFTLYGILAA